MWLSRAAAAANPAGHAAAMELIGKLGVRLEGGATPSSTALIVVTPLGTDATNSALDEGLDATRTEGTGPGQLWTSRLAAPGRLAALTALGITPGPDNQLSGENARGYTLVNADGAALEVNY